MLTGIGFLAVIHTASAPAASLIESSRLRRFAGDDADMARRIEEVDARLSRIEAAPRPAGAARVTRSLALTDTPRYRLIEKLLLAFVDGCPVGVKLALSLTFRRLLCFISARPLRVSLILTFAGPAFWKLARALAMSTRLLRLRGRCSLGVAYHEMINWPAPGAVERDGVTAVLEQRLDARVLAVRTEDRQPARPLIMRGRRTGHS